MLVPCAEAYMHANESCFMRESRLEDSHRMVAGIQSRYHNVTYLHVLRTYLQHGTGTLHADTTERLGRFVGVSDSIGRMISLFDSSARSHSKVLSFRTTIRNRLIPSIDSTDSSAKVLSFRTTTTSTS